MKLTAVTPTGNRPEAFALCEKYMARQTLKPFQWIILDDGDVPTKCTMGQDYIYCPEYRGPTSLVKKLSHLVGNKLAKHEGLVFFEDDDAYAPTWLEFCATHLASYDMIGEGRAIYYNVAKRWWYEHHNLAHASLCSTAIKRKLFSALFNACQSTNPFVDARLWTDVPTNKRVFDPHDNPDRRHLVVGMKALPGRVGYGGGHVVRDINAQDDPTLEKLKSLIGNDAALYEGFWHNTTKMKVPAHTETGKVHGPVWLKHLGHLAGKPDIVGLEIGTFKGDSAEWMCENIFTHETARYYCVDPFTGSVEHHVGKIDCTTLEADSRARLDLFPQSRIIKGYSQDVLLNTKFGDKSLDFIYIDGSHIARDVMVDSVLAFRLVKVGGVICWDDLAWEVFPDPLDKPRIAIESFLKVYARELKVVHLGWQAIAIKTSE
jgi:predicted O-methyltransferase YrrM